MHDPEMTIRREAGRFLMESSAFDDTTDPTEVRRRAQERARVLTNVARLTFGLRAPIAVGAIERTGPDGSLYVCPEPATARVSASILRVIVSRRLPNGTLEEIPRAERVPALTARVLRHRAAAEVLNDWNSVQAHDGNTLYKILEKIEKAIGTSVAERGWASKAERDRFRHSVSSPDVLGPHARHGVQKANVPAKPMKLGAATNFIERILRRFLDELE